MKVKIDIAFDGYPNGDDKQGVHFAVGETIDVSDDFGTLIVGKGLAHAAESTAEQVVHETQ